MIYTVPSGHRTIVKDVRLQSTAAAARTWQLMAFTGANAVLVTAQVALGAAGTAQLPDQWIVLDEGDQLLSVNSGNNLSLWISGSELLIT